MTTGLKVHLEPNGLPTTGGSPIPIHTWTNSIVEGSGVGDFAVPSPSPAPSVQIEGGFPAASYLSSATPYLDATAPSALGNSPLTMILVAKPTDYNHSAGNARKALLAFFTSTSIYRALTIARPINSGFRFSYDEGGFWPPTGMVTSNDHALSRSYVVSVVVSGSKSYLYVNGGSEGGTGTAAIASAISSLRLGAEIVNGSNSATTYDGLVREVLIYNTELSDIDRRNVECVLGGKYGVIVSNCM